MGLVLVEIGEYDTIKSGFAKRSIAYPRVSNKKGLNGRFFIKGFKENKRNQAKKKPLNHFIFIFLGIVFPFKFQFGSG